MIQKESARNGQAVFKLDGLSIVSSFDPSKEANAWAAKILTEIGDHEAVIVIGAGCGYHLQALKNLKPALSILAIEQSFEIQQAVLEIHAGIGARDMIVAEQAIDLSNSPELRDFLSRRFAVVEYAPQAQSRTSWTAMVRTFLTGRDALSFLQQLRMRPELYALLDEKKIAALGETDGLISILTIRSLFRTEAASSRERRIWRVLEELIV